MFDTHTHLNFPDYNEDRKETIKRTLKEGVFMINVGTDIEESKNVINIAKKYKEGVYASVGIHPSYAEKSSKNIAIELNNLVKEKKVVAVGETGLDYINFDNKGSEEQEKIKTIQKRVFREHLVVAKKERVPLILHCRKAHNDILEILKKEYEEEKENKKRGVIHCFTGNKKQLEEYLGLGFYIGINGIIFKMNLEKIIKEIPIERILLETDCPFLSPLKEEKRNEPLFIQYIAKEVARIKKISIEEVAEITTKNAKNLFLK